MLTSAHPEHYASFPLILRSLLSFIAILHKATDFCEWYLTGTLVCRPDKAHVDFYKQCSGASRCSVGCSWRPRWPTISHRGPAEVEPQRAPAAPPPELSCLCCTRFGEQVHVFASVAQRCQTSVHHHRAEGRCSPCQPQDARLAGPGLSHLFPFF